MNSNSPVKRNLDLRAFDAILLDVGNVIFYDFPVELAYSYFMYQEMDRRRAKGYDLTATEILLASREPEESAPALRRAPMWGAANASAWKRVLENWAALCIPIPGALEALLSLSSLRLVLVANQPLQTFAVLEQRGIHKLFAEIVLDSAVGTSKPHSDIYKYAIRRLGAQATSLVMIGDRLDNDIRPAKGLGMTTVWINNFPADRSAPVPLVSDEWKDHYWQARDEASASRCIDESRGEDAPDYIVGCLADLVAGEDFN